VSSLDLQALQELFWQAARGRVAPAELDQHFVARGPRTGAGRMRIYNGAYFARLEDALSDTFPSTKILLGEDRFRALARRYIVEHPSQHPALERVGTHFDQLLSARLPTREHVIANVAELELARVSALLAPDDTSRMGPLDLCGTNLSTVRLRLVRSLVVRIVPTEAFRLWQHPDSSASGAMDPSKRLGVAFWRRDFRVQHHSLELDEAQVLSSPVRSISLLELCEELAVYDDAVTRAVAMIESWRARGFIAGVELGRAEQTESTDANE